MATVGLNDILTDPDAVAGWVEALECVESAAVVGRKDDRVTFRVVLLPHDPTGLFISQGYPVEAAQIVVHSEGRIRAVPKSGRGRRWKHRNSIMSVPLDLCLWDPRDPPEIRWSWEDGFEEYLRTVARHLIYEEYWRRTGEWPVEDSPHGDPPDGSWPIRTAEMRRVLRRRHRG